MSKSIYKFIVLLLFFYFPLFQKIPTTLAQGAYTCSWNSSTGTKGACVPSGQCDPGFSPPTSSLVLCTSASSQQQCPSGSFPCVKTESIESENQQPGTLTDIEREGLPGFRFAGLKLGTVIEKSLPWIFGLAGIALLLYLIYGGFHLMTSGGEPKAMQEAKGKITNALVGFIIIFVAYWIVQIVGRVFGLSGITEIFQ